VIRTRSVIVTTEAVLWKWLNAFSDTSTRAVAAEGYRRTRVDSRIEVVPFEQAGMKVIMLPQPTLRV
jgi:hypothetical protein